MFSNLKIGVRLALGFGVMALLLLAIGATSLFNIRSLSATIEEIDETNTRATAELAKVQNAVWQLRYGISQYIAVPDAASRAAIVADSAKWTAQIDRGVQWYGSLDHQPEERAALDAFAAQYQAYAQARPRWLQLYGEGKFDEAADWRSKTILKSGGEMVRALEGLIDAQREDAGQTQARALATASAAQKVVAASLVLAVLFAMGAGLIITRSIARPLSDAVAATRRVADGDLVMEQRSYSRDQTGQLLQSLKDMCDSLAAVVGQVRIGSDAIASATDQIASGNQDLAQRAEEQASSLEETAASMEQITQTVKQNTESAVAANRLAHSAVEVAVQGGHAVGEVVGTMGSINDSSRKIMEITGVIDGIAFQTNILALNAAVEAARAGEQGRGFAVVASEVRTLAQRSAGAAREIKVLIEDSVSKVGAGTQQVARAGQTMDQIVDGIRRVAEIVGEIATASQEQTRGIEQVNQAITQMDQVTQQNAALVEEAAAAAQSMREQAGELVQAVSVFKLDGRAPAARAATRSAESSRPTAATAAGAALTPRPARRKATMPVPQLALASEAAVEF